LPLVLQTYCPERLASYQNMLDEPKLRHTVKG
jgi:hypothetical protein